MRLKHYLELDGIRATAALMVMFFHFSGQIPFGNAVNDFLKRISPFGQSGVTLFFVLSGFLITRILFSTKEDESYFKTFYYRRALRIFPLYYLYLFIELLVIPSLEHGFGFLDNSWHFWVYLQNIAFTFNWPINGPNHYWSLAVEEHFYLFWPFAVFFLNRLNLRTLIIGLIIGSIFFRFLLLMIGYGAGFYFTFTNMDALAIGGLIAVLEIEQSSFRKPRVYATAFLLFFIPLAITQLFVTGQGLAVV